MSVSRAIAGLDKVKITAKTDPIWLTAKRANRGMAPKERRIRQGEMQTGLGGTGPVGGMMAPRNQGGR